MKVLVLGHTGMLGNVVRNYLRQTEDISFVTTKYRWPTDTFKTSVKNFDGDFIINCIGAIPQRTDKFEINYELPIWLDENVDCRIIHPATDCEMDSDDYGKSKFKAGRHLSLHGRNTKQIVTSIIGHELETNFSLLDWFLSSEGEVFGWSEHYWNGNTTLEWIKQACSLMVDWDKYAKRTVISTDCISKYKLLNIIKEVYEKDIIINKSDEVQANKCLNGQIKTKPIRQQLKELKVFYDN